MLETGARAPDALTTVVIEDPTADYRQLAGIDTAGTTAAPSGQHTIGIHQIAHGDGAVAAGNLLAVPDVIDAMLGGYLHSRHTDLVERLLDGLAGAAAAGGETGPVHSAGRVALHPSAGWASTDLRVDWHDDPIGEIRTLRQLWQHNARTTSPATWIRPARPPTGYRATCERSQERGNGGDRAGRR